MSLFRFGGRSTRREYWVGLSIPFVGFILLLVLGGTVDSALDRSGNTDTMVGNAAAAFLLLCFAVLVWVASANHVKRLHDLGQPAWWLLVVPIAVMAIRSGVGSGVAGLGLLAIILGPGFMRGKGGPNRYGSDPQVAQSATEQTSTRVQSEGLEPASEYQSDEDLPRAGQDQASV